jgi:hypothetical protein
MSLLSHIASLETSPAQNVSLIHLNSPTNLYFPANKKQLALLRGQDTIELYQRTAKEELVLLTKYNMPN